MLLILLGVDVVFLVVDTYPSVKAFGAFVRTPSFWLLTIVFWVLTILAYGALTLSAGEQVKKWVGPDYAPLALVLAAAFGTVSVVQSFTLKVADMKFVDVGSWIEGFKASVLEDMAKQAAGMQSSKAMATATKLGKKFEKDLQPLRDAYALVMQFGGRSLADVKTELEQIETDAAAAMVSPHNALAARIAMADLQYAKDLLAG